MKKIAQALIVLIGSSILAACGAPQPQTNDLELSFSESNDSGIITENTKQIQGDNVKTLEDFEPIKASQVTLKTSKGDITFEIFTDTVPLTTQNFLHLAQDGYFDGILFHRVIPGFMAQAGDPLTKDATKEAQWGTGGPGYTIADEFDPSLKHDGPGVVSMANRGPNTGGSQFFITYDAQPHLDGMHAVFGKVTSGMEVLELITNGDTIEQVTFE